MCRKIVDWVVRKNEGHQSFADSAKWDGANQRIAKIDRVCCWLEVCAVMFLLKLCVNLLKSCCWSYGGDTVHTNPLDTVC